MIYKGKNRYNEWQFIGMEMSLQGGAGGAGGRGDLPAVDETAPAEMAAERTQQPRGVWR